MTAEALRPPPGDLPPLVRQLRERVLEGINIHVVIGAALRDDSRLVTALSLPGRSLDQLDPSVVMACAIPPSIVSRHFANGFLQVAGQLYSTVIRASQRVNGVFPEEETTLDPFEAKRRILAGRLAITKEDQDRQLIGVVDSFESNRSGAAWLRAQMESELPNITRELTDEQRTEFAAGADAAILGAETLYAKLDPRRKNE